MAAQVVQRTAMVPIAPVSHWCCKDSMMPTSRWSHSYHLSCDVSRGTEIVCDLGCSVCAQTRPLRVQLATEMIGLAPGELMALEETHEPSHSGAPRINQSRLFRLVEDRPATAPFGSVRSLLVVQWSRQSRCFCVPLRE